MTYHELFGKLLEKGYRPRKCGDHQLGAYCCAQAVYDAYQDFHDDPAHAEDLLRDFLELDRKAVFQANYGEAEPPAREWKGMLMVAQDEYRHGVYGYCVEYLIKNP